MQKSRLELAIASKLCQQAISMSHFKISVFHAKFCIILCNIMPDWNIKKKMGKRSIIIPFCSTCIQIASLLFLMPYILYEIFCAITYTRKRDLHICRIPKKCDALTDFHEKLFNVAEICYEKSKYEIWRNFLDHF